MKVQFNNKFEEKLIHLTLKIQKLLLYRIIQRTLLLIFPFALFGSFIKIIQTIVLGKEGFLTDVFPTIGNDFIYRQLENIASGLYNMSLGWVSVIAVFGAAKYSAKYFNRDDQLAGITGVSSFLIVDYSYSKIQPISFHPQILGMKGLLFAILWGIFIGWLFKKCSKQIPDTQPNNNVLERTFISLKPIIFSLLIAMLFSTFINITYYSEAPGNFINSLASEYTSNNDWAQLFKTLIFSIYTLIMSFFGWSGTYSALGVEKMDVLSTVNLNYALEKHTAWNAPNPFTSSTLYHAFATFGGTGSILGLIIAILIVSKDKDFQTVARWAMIPSIFNIGSGVMTGIPVLFNIIFLIPFILAPIANMLMAAIAIALHLMPPSVYPVPIGTPGPLIAFIGTNGSWRALMFSILAVIISTWIYIPFVKMAAKVKILDNLGLEEGVK
ncbi:PTS transporter subunit EIIC [Companilactobacillus pabuli]|jgi:PTS system cellobiose-specific IIC component|uniref:Permease IIC component n=1 Tax=Companilactobacillus pabuli TaxID=2714036 RepID=A0A7L7KX92_9LACO|nr:PTS transporter subunit EIIC [Companilactobacillus pabuli]AKP03328.1 PTS sugar transporter subunit IIC [Companilactobacillus farciminis]AKS51627.1 PTS sugar transporter subunit IIC [Companilactobacillus farciminis]MDG5112434.1 PTS transporter subunit EIIC [Companilactobacillus pabuli]QMT83408.1 PTS sugar transporter subunit IIC [Companilactobacillus pabuli]GAQ01261.1 PTS sugar transporter subunit IIC [Companilactobacillus farciminis]